MIKAEYISKVTRFCLALGILPVLALCSCAAETTGSTDGAGTAASDWTVSSDSATTTDDAATGEGADKAGCTYIQWCDAPPSFSAFGIDWGTVCRVQPSCNINSGAIPIECDADLRAIGCSRHQRAVIAYVGTKL